MHGMTFDLTSSMRSHLPKLPQLLESDDVNLRIVAGETIALFYELAREEDEVSRIGDKSNISQTFPNVPLETFYEKINVGVNIFMRNIHKLVCSKLQLINSSMNTFLGNRIMTVQSNGVNFIATPEVCFAPYTLL